MSHTLSFCFVVKTYLKILNDEKGQKSMLSLKRQGIIHSTFNIILRIEDVPILNKFYLELFWGEWTWHHSH